MGSAWWIQQTRDSGRPKEKGTGLCGHSANERSDLNDLMGIFFCLATSESEPSWLRHASAMDRPPETDRTTLHREPARRPSFDPVCSGGRSASGRFKEPKKEPIGRVIFWKMLLCCPTPNAHVFVLVLHC